MVVYCLGHAACNQGIVGFSAGCSLSGSWAVHHCAE